MPDTAGGDSGPASDLSSESSTGQTRTLVLLGQVVLPRKRGEDTPQGSLDVLDGRQGESGGASDDAYGSAAEGEENDGKDRKRGPEENEDGRKAEKKAGEGGVKDSADDGGRREEKEEKGIVTTSSRRPFHMSRRNWNGGRGDETDELCRPQPRSSASYTDVLYREKEKERNRLHKKKHRKGRRRSRSNGREEQDEEGEDSASRRLRRHTKQEGGGQHSVRKKKSKKSRREQGHGHHRSTTTETSHSSSHRFSPSTERQQRCDGPPTTPFIGDATQQLVALYLLTQTLAVRQSTLRVEDHWGVHIRRLAEDQGACD